MRIFPLFALLSFAASSVFAADPSPVAVIELPASDHLVYLSELPESADLMADAAANGLAVLRLDRTRDRVVITYRYPDGHTASVGYALLSSVAKTDRVAATRIVTREIQPEAEIIYVERPTRSRVVYRDRFDDFWLPLSVGFGVGWFSSHHGHHGHHTSWHGRGHRRR